MRYFYLTILILTQSVIHAAIFPNLKTNVLETWNEDDKTRTDVQKAMRHFQNNKGENIKQKNLIQNKELKNDQNIDVYLDLLASKLAENDRRRASRKNFYGHPIFNELKNKRLRSLRRQRLSKDDLFGDSSTNTKERERGNKEMEEAWLLKKMQALNSSTIRGDVANMAAARPWAVPCGDPIQHDMPWGTCMVQTHCEPEYRIYRGDSFCGQTTFICCALQPTNYDLYHAIDISAAEAGTSYSTDSDDAYRDKVMGSREVSKKRDRRQRRNRKLDRAKRKRK